MHGNNFARNKCCFWLKTHRCWFLSCGTITKWLKGRDSPLKMKLALKKMNGKTTYTWLDKDSNYCIVRWYSAWVKSDTVFCGDGENDLKKFLSAFIMSFKLHLLTVPMACLALYVKSRDVIKQTSSDILKKYHWYFLRGKNPIISIN